MEISNYSTNTTCESRQNNPLLLKSIKGVIVGKSGCDKTTLLLNISLKPGWLDYNKLMIFTRSLHQDNYILLKDAFEVELPK